MPSLPKVFPRVQGTNNDGIGLIPTFVGVLVGGWGTTVPPSVVARERFVSLALCPPLKSV